MLRGVSVLVTHVGRSRDCVTMEFRTTWAGRSCIDTADSTRVKEPGELNSPIDTWAGGLRQWAAYASAMSRGNQHQLAIAGAPSDELCGAQDMYKDPQASRPSTGAIEPLPRATHAPRCAAAARLKLHCHVLSCRVHAGAQLGIEVSRTGGRGGAAPDLAE